ncbi:MAG: site-specific integrase [Alphaproteobacteria bacterium]
MSILSESLLRRVAQVPALSRDEIDRLVREHFRLTMMELADLSYCVRHDRSIDKLAEIKGSERAIQNCREEYTNGSFSQRTYRAARNLIDPDKHGDVPKMADEVLKLCEGVLRADQEAHRIFIAMLSGDIAETDVKDPMFKGIDPNTLPSLPGEEIGESTDNSPTILACVDKFCSEKRVAGDWNDKTFQEMRRAFDIFIALVGENQRVASLTKENIRDYRDVLMRLPPNMAKIKDYEKVSVRKVAKENKGPFLSNAAQHKQFSYVKQFFRWSEDQGFVPEDVFGRLSIPRKKKGETNRRPYSTETLNAIFSSPLYTGCKNKTHRSANGKMVIQDGKYWVPLIGLYAGMRLGEIVQLQVSDIRKTGTTYFIDVNKGLDEGDDGKRLKTANAVRQIPVHEQLVSFGFLRFVEGLRSANPESRLFPEIKPGKNGIWSDNFSKWWGRYTKKIGVHSPGTVFHSFRHNFTDALRKANVQDSRAKALLGHADGSTTAGYGNGYDASDLAEDIARVKYNLDFSHLCRAANEKSGVHKGHQNRPV